ncbi:MAG: phage tail tape measure protein [Ruminococcus sp.]|nr:phage tail tape measure protein [Ruminococcus sp.]
MSYDGSLKFDTKISTAEFAEGLKKIQEIAKSGLSKVEISIDSVNESVKESTKQISKNETQSEEWKSELNDLRTALSKVKSKLDDSTTSVNNLSDEIHNVDKKTDNLGDEVKETSKNVEKFDNTSKEASESVEKLGNTSSKTKGKLELLKTAANKVEDGFTGIIKTAGKAISTTAKVVAAGVGVVSTGALAIGTSAVKAGIDFESAFAGVEKTVDATDEQLGNLRKGLLDMSKEIPQSAANLSAIAESAGQLGIETNNIEKFTKVMANLGVATNMTSDEAATSLARFANITGMPQKNFDKLGSTIVALGNNLATTESEIVDMSLRIAGTGKQVGMSESQIMSFSAALSSVGIEAEMGGSAFSTLLSKMQLATDKGGEDLDKFAKVAGVSGGEFKKLFQKDATEAVSAFLKGLNKINENGGSAISTLDDMDLSEVRMRDTLLRASSASDVFTKAMSTGTEAWKENNALAKEANKRYETLESKIQLMKNGIQNLGIAFKDSIDTDLRSAVQLGTKYIDELSKSFTDGGLQGAVKTAGDIFGEIATKAAENAPKMIDSALQFIDSFANGIRDNSSRLLTAGRNIVQSIIEGIIDFAGYGSELIDGAVAIIENLILAISANESELLKAGESIIDSIVNGIVNLANNAGTVVRGVAALIQSFIKSVKNNKDKLLTAAKEIVKAITDGLVTLLPENVQAPVKKCIEAITKFFNSNSLKKAIQSVTKFIGTLAKSISDMASNVVPPLIKVLEFLCSNLNIIGPVILTVVSAIKIYKGTVELAKIAQLGFNAAMSANPIGAAITLIEGLVTGLTALCGWLSQTSGDTEALNEAQDNYNIAAENTRKIAENYGDKLSGITEAMDKCRDGIDNATSSLDGFDESLIIPEDTKKNLEKDMTDVQTRIDKICSGYSTGRKELTQKEIEELDNLMKKQKELADKELELQSEYQTTANGIAQEFISKFKGTPEEYSEQSKTYIKGAEEARDKVITAAEEQYKKRYQLATKEYKAGAITKKAYENEKNAAWKAKEEAIKAAKEKCGQTEALITNHYTKLITGTDKFISNNNKATKAFDEAYIRAGKRIGGYHDLLEVGQINQEQYSANTKKVWADYETDTGAILDDIVNNLDEATMTQIGDWAGLVKTTYESGGKISDDTAYMAYNIRESIKNLPDDVKKKMGDTYDKLINSFDGLPPEMYEQGKAAAEALKKPTGKDLSDDMSKNGKDSVTSFVDSASSKTSELSKKQYDNGHKLGGYFAEGYYDGLSSWNTPLEKRAEYIATMTPLKLAKEGKINSPSKVMMELGRYMVEGYIIGLGDKAKKLAEMSKSLADSVSGTMSNGLNNDIMLDTNAEMTARLKTAVFAQAGEIGLSVATKNANNYDTQSDSNNSVKASGNITTHINIDGREFAVATVPYIDEELAFIKG